MGKSLGSSATIEVSTDNITYNRATKVKKASMPVKVNAVDSTDNDDNGWKSNLYGDAQVPISFTLNYDPSDSNQITILNAKRNKTKVYLRYKARGTGAGLDVCSGLAVIEEATVDSEHEKVQELVVSGKSDGTWTETTQ